MLDVIPLNKRVIARVLEKEFKEETTKSGLVLPGSNVVDVEGAEVLMGRKSKKENFLEVVAVDPQITDIKIGDLIYISKYSGDNFKEEGTEYHYIEYKDIIGKKLNV